MRALCVGAIAWVCVAHSMSPASASPPAPSRPTAAAFGRANPEPEAPIDSNAVKQLLRLADVQRRARNRDAERAYLVQVIEHDSSHSHAHARLAEITGPAPTDPGVGSSDLVRLALEHPYDPKALVAAAGELARRGSSDQAVEFLERSVWLADLDPSAALTAIQQLYVLSDDWKQRRIVPVQLHVDALIRAQAGWKFQLRTLWLSSSSMLDPVLQTRFVPIAMLPFDADHIANDLDAIHEAFLAETRPPAEGILAAITGRPIPSGDAVHKKGVAEFLGRSLSIRLAPGAIRSRVHAHEILHLYGAIHVLGDADTLMNPAGVSSALDAPNVRIARALRGRAFGPGGIEENVLPWIDLGETVAAYRSALSVNLSLRDAEIEQAMGARHTSADEVAFRVQQATQLDSHLADAARLVAALMLADSRRSEALRLLDLSSQLYGPSTPRGRATADKAKLLRESMEASEVQTD